MWMLIVKKYFSLPHNFRDKKKGTTTEKAISICCVSVLDSDAATWLSAFGVTLAPVL